jgi:hypothetical protein
VGDCPKLRRCVRHLVSWGKRRAREVRTDDNPGSATVEMELEGLGPKELVQSWRSGGENYDRQPCFAAAMQFVPPMTPACSSRSVLWKDGLVIPRVLDALTAMRSCYDGAECGGFRPWSIAVLPPHASLCAGSSTAAWLFCRHDIASRLWRRLLLLPSEIISTVFGM